ncbi:MAG: Hpt domain-containing protein [Bacteroidetes bacterium]|nr:Hpt domain-containing protein [Bacteroidota bacterium]
MDLDFLDKFTGGDQELTIQLIEIFLKQVPEAIGEVECTHPRRDWKETHAVAHKLKSSIAIFELHELKNSSPTLKNMHAMVNVSKISSPLC